MPDTHQFFTKQHEQLNRLETKMVKAQADIQSARTETLESLQAKRDRAAAGRQGFQSRVTESVTKMKASAEARRDQTDAAVDEWKRKREVKKLENRARDLEDYADAAIGVLDAAQDEAVLATLDAIEARRLAEEAKAGAPA